MISLNLPTDTLYYHTLKTLLDFHKTSVAYILAYLVSPILSLLAPDFLFLPAKWGPTT